jgi:YHS domain-containing protein
LLFSVAGTAEWRNDAGFFRVLALSGLITFGVIILIFLGVFLFLKSYKKPQQQGPRFFRAPSFSKVRREQDKGKLHRDPVSGTYVSESDAIVVVRSGKKYYFASEENAERFRRGEVSETEAE